MLETVFIGLGSNLGQPVENLHAAFSALSETKGMANPLLSPLYWTPPYGIKDQPEFVNAVARFQSELSTRNLLDTLLSIEENMGRVRKEKWGPRLIDLDLLFYGKQVIEEEGLNVPHPGIPDRDFVLIPLADIAPDWQHPTANKSIRELASELGEPNGLRRVESEG